MGPNFGSQKMFDLPPCCESVDKATSAENLKAVASKNAEPQVLLGLTFLARTGSSVRQELSDMVVKAKSEYAPIVAVLALSMDGVDEQSVGELIKRDPDNALGYYLQATLLYGADRENETLVGFRKAAHCSELRLYESTTGDALFKALDALNLKGRDRLCALSWMASRSSNFSTIVLQPLRLALSELAHPADIGTHQEISELLLVLAGHLFATNFYNRWFAKQALESAVFELKAKVPAAEKFPTMIGSASATQSLVSTIFRWPGTKLIIEEDMKPKPLELARCLPDSIHRAFAVADPCQISATYAGEMHLNLPDNAKAAFKKAKENAMKAARTLIDVALTDPDGIVGAYLKGLPPSPQDAHGRWVVPAQTFVEKLMCERPDVFSAAAANQEAMNALWDAGASDPGRRNGRRNMTRMMEIGWVIHSYASDHGDTYPESINVLFDKGYLRLPVKAQSLVTGRSYVYVAAGEKIPIKSRDRARFVLLYDDHGHEHGYYECVFASWAGGGMCVAELKEQLRKRGK